MILVKLEQEATLERYVAGKPCEHLRNFHYHDILLCKGWAPAGDERSAPATRQLRLIDAAVRLQESRRHAVSIAGQCAFAICNLCNGSISCESVCIETKIFVFF
ncbi:hypothetical protein ACLOJK_012695 [Asimina triloba]